MAESQSPQKKVDSRDIRTISYTPSIINNAFSTFYVAWVIGLFIQPIFITEKHSLLFSAASYFLLILLVLGFLIISEAYIIKGNRTGNWMIYLFTLSYSFLFLTLLSMYYVYIHGGSDQTQNVFTFIYNRKNLHEILLIWFGWILLLARVMVTEIFYKTRASKSL